MCPAQRILPRRVRQRVLYSGAASTGYGKSFLHVQSQFFHVALCVCLLSVYFLTSWFVMQLVLKGLETDLRKLMQPHTATNLKVCACAHPNERH